MEPVVLWDSNSTVVHLAPAPVVAKVATNTTRTDAADAMTHELAVSLHLTGLGAPVAEPWPEMPAASAALLAGRGCGRWPVLGEQEGQQGGA